MTPENKGCGKIFEHLSLGHIECDSNLDLCPKCSENKGCANCERIREMGYIPPCLTCCSKQCMNNSPQTVKCFEDKPEDDGGARTDSSGTHALKGCGKVDNSNFRYIWTCGKDGYLCPSCSNNKPKNSEDKDNPKGSSYLDAQLIWTEANAGSRTHPKRGESGGEMREIKFRAWNGRQILSGDVLVGIPLLISPANGNVLNPKSYTEHFGNIELMQFTGLKDKNGRDIYEGDIVQTRWIEDDEVYVGEVIFDSGCFRLKIEEMFIPHFDSKYQSTIRELEIIGNKFENPELLESTHNTAYRKGEE